MDPRASGPAGLLVVVDALLYSLFASMGQLVCRCIDIARVLTL
jgi:hypothetical protein